MPALDLAALRKHLSADLHMRYVECHQVSERHADELHLPSKHSHGRAMVIGPGDAATVDQMIDLANALRPPDEVSEPQGGVVDVQVLMHGVAVVAYQERFPLANPVNPGKIPGDLAQQPLRGAIGRRRLDNGDGEALAVVGLQEDRIRLYLVPPVGRGRTQGMILRHGHPIIGDPIRADGGTLHEVLDMRKGAHTAGGFIRGETPHVNGGIEQLALHGLLECGTVPPVTLNPACPLGDMPTSPAIKTRDLVALLEQ